MKSQLSLTISDLCDLVTAQVEPASCETKTYVGLEHIEPGRLIRSRQGTAKDVRSMKNSFQPGDILYGKLRPYLDKAVLANDFGICSTELLVLRPRTAVDPRFVVAVLHAPSFVDFAVSGSSGVQHPRTSWNHLRGFEIPAFDSDEQSQIADCFWGIEAAYTGTENAWKAGAELIIAARRVLFTYGLRGDAQKETEIGLIPQGWAVVPLGRLGRVGNGSTPKKSVTQYWNDGDFPWLTSAKVYDRNIVAADQFVTSTALRECHLPIVEPGAILIAITGQGKTLGNCAVLRTRATVNQHIAYVATNLAVADPSFVRSYLETKYDYFRQIGSAGGSTKGALTCAFLRGVPIPLPPTLEEQQDVAAVLDAINRKCDLMKGKRAILDELFKKLMHKLLAREIHASDLSHFRPTASDA